MWLECREYDNRQLLLINLDYVVRIYYPNQGGDCAWVEDCDGTKTKIYSTYYMRDLADVARELSA